MQKINRREFLKLGCAALAWPMLSSASRFTDQLTLEAAPASLGRIATGWWQAVRVEASPTGEWVAWKKYDELIPLYAAVIGEAPWPSNPIWYQTDEGFIHSGYVQPVENTPTGEVVTEVGEPGMWVQVCVPIAESRWKPASPYVARKLYYGTIYRAVGATVDEGGNWWYQLQEGITYSPGPYVPAWSARPIPVEELSPISPGQPDKRIEINLENHVLTCFEGENAVFSTRVASGMVGTATPRGEHRLLYKRHTSRMIGGVGNDRYDLPGVAFPVYFTWSGVAIHGTYWHNDYGRRKSHGCVNVTNEAAKWIFRWTEPAIPYQDYHLKVEPGEGTLVVVS